MDDLALARPCDLRLCVDLLERLIAEATTMDERQRLQSERRAVCEELHRRGLTATRPPRRVRL